MKTFHYLADLKASTPDADGYAFFDQEKCVYVWMDGEWVQKKYFSMREITKLLDVQAKDIRKILVTYNRYFQYKRKKGRVPRISYGMVLRLRFILKAQSAGDFHKYSPSFLSNIYQRAKDHHPIGPGTNY